MLDLKLKSKKKTTFVVVCWLWGDWVFRLCRFRWRFCDFPMILIMLGLGLCDGFCEVIGLEIVESVFDGNEGCVALRFDTGYCYWKIFFSLENIFFSCNFVQVSWWELSVLLWYEPVYVICFSSISYVVWLFELVIPYFIQLV